MCVGRDCPCVRGGLWGELSTCMCWCVCTCCTGPPGMRRAKGAGVCARVCVTVGRAPALARAGGDRVPRVGSIDAATVGTGDEDTGGPAQTHGVGVLWGCWRRGARDPQGQLPGSCWVPVGTSPVPPSHIGAVKRGVWRWPCTQPGERDPSGPPVLEQPELCQGSASS